MKTARQRTILELLEEGPIPSQEELQARLLKRGFQVGQATLSRDVRELGLVKGTQGYSRPAVEGGHEPSPAPVSRLAREFVLDIRPAQNLIVLKTTTGSAQPVALALDGEGWPEVVGTIAGDDTILVVAQTAARARSLARRIQGMIQ